jgi:hypothetical protein
VTTYTNSRPRSRAPAATPPVVQPAPRPDTLEWAADEVAAWITTTADAVIAAVMESDRAPFSAPVSQSELASYYGETLYTPMGLPDSAAWQAEFQRVGAPGLVEAVEGAIKWRKGQGLPVLELPPLGPPKEPTPMDVVDENVQTMPMPEV